MEGNCAHRARGRVGGRGLRVSSRSRRSGAMLLHWSMLEIRMIKSGSLEGCCASEKIAGRCSHMSARRSGWVAPAHIPLCRSIGRKLGKALLAPFTRPSSTGLPQRRIGGVRPVGRQRGFLPPRRSGHLCAPHRRGLSMPPHVDNPPVICLRSQTQKAPLQTAR